MSTRRGSVAALGGIQLAAEGWLLGEASLIADVRSLSSPIMYSTAMEVFFCASLCLLGRSCVFCC